MTDTPAPPHPPRQAAKPARSARGHGHKVRHVHRGHVARMGLSAHEEPLKTEPDSGK